MVQELDGQSLQFKDVQPATFTLATSATTGYTRCHLNGQVFREGKESVPSELPVIDPAFEIALETKGHDEIERCMAIVEKQEEENEQKDEEEQEEKEEKEAHVP